jgi:hypothetical protein
VRTPGHRQVDPLGESSSVSWFGFTSGSATTAAATTITEACLLRVRPPHGVPGRLLLGPLLPPLKHGRNKRLLLPLLCLTDDASTSTNQGDRCACRGQRRHGRRVCWAWRARRWRPRWMSTVRRRRLRLEPRVRPPHGASRALHARLAHGRRPW